MGGLWITSGAHKIRRLTKKIKQTKGFSHSFVSYIFCESWQLGGRNMFIAHCQFIQSSRLSCVGYVTALKISELPSGRPQPAWRTIPHSWENELLRNYTQYGRIAPFKI